MTEYERKNISGDNKPDYEEGVASEDVPPYYVKEIISEDITPDCRERIMSEEYGDFIVEFDGRGESALMQYKDYCPQIIGDRYFVVHEKIENITDYTKRNYPYTAIPKLYGLMDTTSVAATGAIRLQNQTSFELTGRGVIVGFIDTGIDYTKDIFKNQSGRTRIINIWDQTNNQGNTPEGFLYGTEYSMEEINNALESSNPQSVVNHTDENGHGTFLAGVACGGYDERQDFIGSAPESLIAMVKLKPAKKYLKEYYLVENNEPAFQENDIMMAANYLRSLRIKYDMPLVIVLGLGSANGDRAGGTPCARYLSNLGKYIGQSVVVATGNESTKRLHYQGKISENQVDDVEIKVGEDDKGFIMELWANSPDLFSVGFTSPLGENVPRIPPRKGTRERVNFLLEGTTIEVFYKLVEFGSGKELIFIRVINPSPGIWTIRVYGSNILNGEFNIWTNLSQYMVEDTYFLKPNPDTTLTVPSSGEGVISIGGYDNFSNSIYSSSGRGYTIDGRVKPDMVAPSVNVYGPATERVQGGFTKKTGTSVGTALTAGCVAQMFQWGLVEENDIYMNGISVKNYLIRGASREREIDYPNRQWGYGQVDVYNSFLILTRS